MRIIGYACLISIAALVGIGLLTEKRRWASVGAVALFLPVFGHFALSMSLLAGLGLLRIAWMPIIEHFPALLRLGDVGFVPYMAAVYVPALASIDIRAPLIYGFMGGGILLFTLGTFGWFQMQFRGRRVADLGVYRISRHPQYLGWIVWSYGLMIYVSRMRGPRIPWSVESSLPWIIASLILVCVALKEEIAMRRERPRDYGEYVTRTPFLLPVPAFVTRAVAAPMRLALGKSRPETGRDVVVVFAVYAGLVILCSLPFAVFDWPERAQAMWRTFPYNVPPFR
jgi:protein-S-isoprenylcysteine O-methyltransferase Ste14